MRVNNEHREIYINKKQEFNKNFNKNFNYN